MPTRRRAFRLVDAGVGGTAEDERYLAELRRIRGAAQALRVDAAEKGHPRSSTPYSESIHSKPVSGLARTAAIVVHRSAGGGNPCGVPDRGRREIGGHVGSGRAARGAGCDRSST